MNEPTVVYAYSQWAASTAYPFRDIQNVWEKTKFDTMRIPLIKMRDLMDFCLLCEISVTWDSMDGANLKKLPEHDGINFNIPNIEVVRNGPDHIEFHLDGKVVARLLSV